MCYSPMWRFECSEVDLFLKGVNPRGFKNGGFVFSKKRIDLLEYLSAKFHGDMSRLKEIPCGQCLECRLSEAKDKAQRACMEAKQYTDNWFVTLTYDDEKLEPDDLIQSINPITLQSGTFINLNKSAVQAFDKRLRSRLEYSIGHVGMRAMYCGEYGPQTGRAHYHLNLFNCPLPDLKIWKKVNIQGKNIVYYNSEIIDFSWKKGFAVIMPFTYETAAYVARYILKKQKGKSFDEYEKYCRSLGYEPMNNEFQQLPLRPGLGRKFYDDNSDKIYEFDSVVMPNGIVAKPSKYYDRLFDAENPELFAEIKQEREKIASLKNYASRRSGISDESRLECRKVYSEQRLKKLSRLDI